MAAVWGYFRLSEKEQRFAVCKICSSEISRGGQTTKNFNTTNLISHLQRKHGEAYNEYLQMNKKRQEEAKKNAKTNVTQLSLTTAFERKAVFPADSVRARGITNRITKMIALDDQPFSVVENVGFRGLMEYVEPRYKMPSRRYFSDVCLPELYNVVATRIHELLASDIPAISFTTDIWSSDVSPMSMLSLTAQWIDVDFNLIKAVLHSQEFTGSHTASAISEEFEKMFDKWKIDKSKVHAVVRDNARNMVKAMSDMGLVSFGCVAHTLQLAIHDAVLCQRSVSDVVASCRKIVGHFKHSPLAYSRLFDLQVQFGIKIKRLQQDVSTRWNSTFYMLKSILEQKHTLATYATEHDLPATLTVQQWTLIENIVTLLSPFEQLTRQLSSGEASAADVIPSVQALRRLLSREADTDQGVKTTKTALLDAVNKRFASIESDPMFCISTLLDPRYKDCFFEEDAKARIRVEVAAQLERPGTEGGGGDAIVSESEETSNHSPSKKTRVEGASSTLHEMFEEILEQKASERPKTKATVQLEGFLAESPIPRNEKALGYWKNHHPRFPEVAQMARRYLSAPCTSTDSERLFSAASLVLDEKRNRLTCSKAEMLLFVKKNIHLQENRP